MQRINVHTYMMVVAKAVALRSTCPRRAVGAVAVRNDEIVATGYNGSPHHCCHCIDISCLMNTEINPRCVRTVHAELNALLKANGYVDTLYTTDQPCFTCYKVALQRGVTTIFYERPYPDKERDAFIHQQNPLCKMVQMNLSNVILEITE